MSDNQITRANLIPFIQRLAINDPDNSDVFTLTHRQVSQMIELILRNPTGLTAFDIFSLKLMIQPDCSHYQRRLLAAQLLKEITLINDEFKNDDPF